MIEPTTDSISTTDAAADLPSTDGASADLSGFEPDSSPDRFAEGAEGIENQSRETPQSVERGSILRRVFAWLSWMVGGIFSVVSLIVCLAVLASIPLLQLITFGYLLDVAGRLAAGGTFRHSLPHLQAAGKIGLVVGAVVVGSLPVQLLAHWESVASLITPGSDQADLLRLAAIAAAFVGIVYLLWALSRGGRLVHFLWPAPASMLRKAWRPRTYWGLPDKLWQFTGSLELGRYFWLGLRGAGGTLVWLIPAMIIIAANRNGETGLAGLVGGDRKSVV